MAIPSIPYRSTPHTPFWGPANSNFNFCETDYIITPYIAEFINTLTNTVYVYYAYRGISSNLQRAPDVRTGLSRCGTWFGILGVGLGSMLFHSTMKNYTQWADDLSMLIATAINMHRVFTYDASHAVSMASGLGLATFVSLFSVWHCIVDETGMHSLLFGIMIVVVNIRVRFIIRKRVKSKEIKGKLNKLSFWGGGVFLLGYGLWNLDYVVCGWLGDARSMIGMPWGWMLELHGWWHILTGIGSYIGFVNAEYLTGDDVGSKLEGRYAWPVDWILEGSKPAGVKPEKTKKL